MSAPTQIAIDVVGHGLATEQLQALMERRTLRTRLRRFTRPGAAVVHGEGTVFWPIALVNATASGAGRRPWILRNQGAVDLVSGRVGLVDLDLPSPHVASVPDHVCIPPRVPRGIAEVRWHEFFRDHVDRQRKPLRPPVISVDEIRQVWLPAHVVCTDQKRYLVDGLTQRIDELVDFPYVDDILTKRDVTRTTGGEKCKA